MVDSGTVFLKLFYGEYTTSMQNILTHTHFFHIRNSWRKKNRWESCLSKKGLSPESFVWAHFFVGFRFCCCCRIIRFWSTPKQFNVLLFKLCACVYTYAYICMYCYRLCILISLKECSYIFRMGVFDILLCQLFICFLIARFFVAPIHMFLRSHGIRFSSSSSFQLELISVSVLETIVILELEFFKAKLGIEYWYSHAMIANL